MGELVKLGVVYGALRRGEFELYLVQISELYLVELERGKFGKL